MTNASSSSTQPSPGPSDDALSQQLQNAITLAAKQDTIVWAVFSVFSAVSVALLVALFPEGNLASPLMGMTLCAAGLVAALVWAVILSRAIAYFGRYEEKVRALEERLELRDFSLAERLAGPSTRTLMITVAVVVALLCLFGLIVFATARTPGPSVNVTVPDTLKVSVQGAVPVNARIGEVTVKMPAEPIWESNLASALGAAIVAILTVFLAQYLRDRAEEGRTTARLVTRIRSALETAALTLKTVVRVKGDGTKEIDAQTMGGIILEWSRYDRVSDDIGLLKSPRIEEEIDNILGAARQVAEAALEDERRFKAEVSDFGERVAGGVRLPQQVIDRIYAQRRKRLEQMKYMGEVAQRVLDAFDSRWKPPRWHERRKLAEPVDEPAVG